MPCSTLTLPTTLQAIVTYYFTASWKSGCSYYDEFVAFSCGDVADSTGTFSILNTATTPTYTVPTSILDWSCAQCGAADATIPAYVCKLCNDGYHLSASLTCNGCWLTYQYSTYGLTINTAAGTITLTVSGVVYFNLLLVLEVGFDWQQSLLKQFLNVPLLGRLHSSPYIGPPLTPHTMTLIGTAVCLCCVAAAVQAPLHSALRE